MKLYCVMTEIHLGLIIKSSSLYAKKKTVFKRFRIDRSNICLNSIAASKQKYYCRMTNKLINAEKSSKA